MQQINFLATLRGVQKMRFDYCQFGALWKKPNTMLVFGDSNFKRHASTCVSYCKNDKFPNCGVLHVRLSGHDKNTNGQCYFRTWIAEPYPEQFCSEWARLINDDYTTRTNSAHFPGPHHGHKLNGLTWTLTLMGFLKTIDLGYILLKLTTSGSTRRTLHRRSHHLTILQFFYHTQDARHAFVLKPCENNIARNSVMILRLWIYRFPVILELLLSLAT